MAESGPKSKLVDLLRQELPRFVIIRHEDKSTYGIPDISITGNGFTSWLEGKHANPDFKSHGIQELTMRRLANVGHYARYIIWDENGGHRRLLIVHPNDLKNWQTKYDEIHIGFNNFAIVEKIKSIHQL